MQRFAQNALASMTTPVAPAAMSVRVGRRHLHIWVRRPQDPFVLAARVYVRRGTGPLWEHHRARGQ
jgi:hypothetical protein